MNTPPACLLVLTTLPDRDSAEALAAHLVEARLAACVSIQGPCRSLYRWQGAVEAAEEVPLLIKTAADRYDALAAAIGERHPYDLPELIALPITTGSAAYLAWIAGETRPLMVAAGVATGATGLANEASGEAPSNKAGDTPAETAANPAANPAGDAAVSAATAAGAGRA